MQTHWLIRVRGRNLWISEVRVRMRWRRITAEGGSRQVIGRILKRAAMTGLGSYKNRAHCVCGDWNGVNGQNGSAGMLGKRSRGRAWDALIT